MVGVAVEQPGGQSQPQRAGVFAERGGGQGGDSGETFSSLLNAARAELAERLVSNPRRSLTEIAEQLGFSEPSAFSRWFRGQFGRIPSEWRGVAARCS